MSRTETVGGQQACRGAREAGGNGVSQRANADYKPAHSTRNCETTHASGPGQEVPSLGGLGDAGRRHGVADRVALGDGSRRNGQMTTERRGALGVDETIEPLLEEVC